MPTSVAASAATLAHLLSLCLSFSLLCAKAQCIYIHQRPHCSSTCPLNISCLAPPSEALSSVVTSLALFAHPL